MSFAKFAAEALIPDKTPDQLEADARRNHWKKWALTIGGLGAIGYGGKKIYDNWGTIAPKIDAAVDGLGTKPKWFDKLPLASAVAVPVVDALSRVTARATGGLKGLRQAIAEAPEHLKGQIQALDSTVGTHVRDAGGKPMTAAMAFANEAPHPTSPFASRENLRLAAKGATGASTQVAGHNLTPATFAHIDDVLGKVHGAHLRNSTSVGRLGKGAVGGFAAGWLGQQLGKYLEKNVGD